MNWFDGSIQDAVTTSKRRKAYFIVYVEGSDESSKVMTKVLDNKLIANKFETKNFVAIKLTKDSEGHKQFEAFYKLVPVPSVFFIDQNGSPAEIVVSDKTEENVFQKLNNAIDKCIPENKLNNSVAGTSATGEPSTSHAGSISSPDIPSTSNAGLNCEGTTTMAEQNQNGVEVMSKEKNVSLKEVEQTLPEADEKPSAGAEASIEERIEKAKMLLEKKKEEKIVEERNKEKEAELERRRVGREMILAKREQQERALREVKEGLEREKKAEALARQHVLEQIRLDWEDRHRLGMTNSSGPIEETVEAPTAAVSVDGQETASPPSVNVSVARLQFKLPSGETKMHSFPASTTLLQVREFIDNNIVLPSGDSVNCSSGDYQLATTFPRRQFTNRDNARDLSSLELVPSAVILILPIYGTLSNVRSTSYGWAQVVIDMMWDLVQPVLSLSRYLQNRFLRRGNTSGTSTSETTPAPTSSSSSTSSGRPTQHSFGQRLGGTSTVKRRGNIYTLSDNSEDTDENNTWNGNSTQQM